ncbi:TonB-dependent receptor plug domain-containing protein [Sulfurimonas sp.]|uniref:TonB-dependent receptor plug domain-containing protein n=1 Tax=Sulfurimonas sp. TaxID=2022749 RepID=UPI00286D797D|nr:TonB-dependent receptor plug domain-containing protein [Sulfurimonas sp.]
MRFLVFLLLLTALLFSEELSLENLLKEYKSSEELYHNTKKESAGHVTVFSRSDLDKMQAYTLNDVLKTLRFFTLQTRRNGMTTLVRSGESQMSSSPVKVYINSHELNSATLGNVLVQYGKMGLYFIDHIEVYQSGNSVTFGNEPGTMLIKLYTKEPSRENSTSTQASVDSLGSITLQGVDAKKFDDYSYLANVDLRKNNHKDYTTANSKLSRDGARGQFYFKFSKDSDYDIEVGATQEKYDIFSGLGMATIDGYTYTQDIYAHLTKYFENNLKIMLTTSHENFEIYDKDSIAIPIPTVPFQTQLNTEVSTEVYSAIIEKKFIDGNNELSLGAQFKHQKFKINEYKTDGIDRAVAWGPKDLDIYMIYAENLYNINKNHLISLSAKMDYYENEFSKSSTEHILRAGYIALLDDEWKFKLFAMDSYIYPTFIQTTYSPNYNVNPDLESSDILLLTAEMIYSKDNTTFGFGVGRNETDNAIVFNMSQNKYVNDTEKNSFELIFANIEHNFDIDNKIKIEYFRQYREAYYSPRFGASLQLFNTVGKFNFYNELIYRSEYTSIDGIDMSEGYDYSLGAIYKLNKQTELKLKAENILDKASKTPINGIDISATDRRVLLTMEYTF